MSESSESTDGTIAAWVKREKPWALWSAGVLVFAAGFLFILSTVDGWPARYPWLLVLIAAPLIALGSPQAISRLGFEINIGGQKLTYEPSRAIQESDEAEGPNPSDLKASQRMAAWREQWLKLEMKIAYLAKHTLPDHLPIVDPKTATDGGNRPYANIGSLLEDDLLDDGEAQLGELMLRVSNTEFGRLSTKRQIELLEKAQDFARTVRARVFRRLVVKYIVW